MLNDDQPPITDADRAILKERLTAQFKDQKTSGRRVEKRIGLPVGTISKICSGRVRLTLRVLKEVADVLGVGPDVLVAGTNFANLLLGAPETDSDRELADARAELDKLRAEIAGHEAAHQQLRADLEGERRAREAAERATADYQGKTAAAEREAAVIKTACDAATKQLAGAHRALVSTQQEVTRLQAEVARVTAVANYNGSQADTWRRAHGQAQARINYLESELLNLQASLQHQSQNATGKTFLAALAALGIGVALGANSDT